MTDGPVAPSPPLSPERGTVDAGHPMLAGHFPGHPIVPGAWLLAWVVAAATRRLETTGDRRAVAGVKRVKFLRPLVPGKAFECELKAGAETLRFTLTSDGSVIADGSLQLQARCAIEK